MLNVNSGYSGQPGNVLIALDEHAHNGLPERRRGRCSSFFVAAPAACELMIRQHYTIEGGTVTQLLPPLKHSLEIEIDA